MIVSYPVLGTTETWLLQRSGLTCHGLLTQQAWPGDPDRRRNLAGAAFRRRSTCQAPVAHVRMYPQPYWKSYGGEQTSKQAQAIKHLRPTNDASEAVRTAHAAATSPKGRALNQIERGPEVGPRAHAAEDGTRCATTWRARPSLVKQGGPWWWGESRLSDHVCRDRSTPLRWTKTSLARIEMSTPYFVVWWEAPWVHMAPVAYLGAFLGLRP